MDWSRQHSLHSSLRARRESIVRDHVAAENAGDLDGVVASFHHPRYEVFPLATVVEGAEGVRALVGGLIGGFPDFNLICEKLHHADDAVIVEARMTGTHGAEWAGLPPLGRRLDIPLVCIFDFENERLIGEKVHFDFATVQRQLS